MESLHPLYLQAYGPHSGTMPVFIYASTQYCKFKRKSLLQTFDMPASLLASTLVSMEITVNSLMKLGDYPSEVLEKVTRSN